MEKVLDACREAKAKSGRIVVLTGAGVSAESGIPTFRGKEGYWTVGAREYHPAELATKEAFETIPWESWAWYLYRLATCRQAEPNAGHRALAALAGRQPRFSLVTQNVDGLHRRAGSPDSSTYPIHGDISLMRCAKECSAARWPIPDSIEEFEKGDSVDAATKALLVCPTCGSMARPHVLWFDESYDEVRFHLDTVRRIAADAALVVVAGTSAQTNLPWQVVTLAARNGATIVDVNIEDNPFGDIALESGGVVREPAAAALQAICGVLAD
jgi:NAD-dependent deacetylase